MAERPHEKAFVERIKQDPEWFMRRVLGVQYLTPQQLKVITSVRDNRRTAAPAGHGVGKTFLAALLVLWFLYANVNSKVVTTAPTWFQVENLLWRNLKRAHTQSLIPLGGNLGRAKLELDDEWYAVGLSTNDPTRFQGIHAPRVMVVFDEATGVHPEIWDASNGLVVGTDDRILGIGNPTDPSSQFKVHCDSGLWNVIELSSEDHPNVLEGRVIIPGAVTREWIEEREKEYGGRETGLFRARVLGKWPEQGDDILISQTLVEAAQAKWSQLKPSTIIAIGCDVARFGSDETVFFEIHENGFVPAPIVKNGQDLMATAGELYRHAKSGIRVTRIGVDDAGLGGGVTDRLREMGVRVQAVNAGEGATASDEFVNRRAEMWWALREELRAGTLALPPDPKLKGDLTNLRYSYDSRGRIKLEPKDDVKERIGRSPDRGDALAIAVWAMKHRGGEFKSTPFRR